MFPDLARRRYVSAGKVTITNGVRFGSLDLFYEVRENRRDFALLVIIQYSGEIISRIDTANIYIIVPIIGGFSKYNNISGPLQGTPHCIPTYLKYKIRKTTNIARK